MAPDPHDKYLRRSKATLPPRLLLGLAHPARTCSLSRIVPFSSGRSGRKGKGSDVAARARLHDDFAGDHCVEGVYTTRHGLARAKQRNISLDVLRKAASAPDSDGAEKQKKGSVTVVVSDGLALTAYHTAPKLVRAQFQSTLPRRPPRPDLTVTSAMHTEVRFPNAEPGWVGQFIGKGGANVSELKAAHNCEVYIPPTDQRDREVVIRIGAETACDLDRARVAVEATHRHFRDDAHRRADPLWGRGRPPRPDLTATSAEQTEVRFPNVEPGWVGMFIGKGGANVSAFKAAHNCEVYIPPTDQRDREVVIRIGAERACDLDRARVAVEATLRRFDPLRGRRLGARVTITKLPDAAVGQVIGKGGCRIAELKETSRCDIHIKRASTDSVDTRHLTYSTYTAVVAGDTAADVDTAKVNVRDAIEKAAKGSSERFKCPRCQAEFTRWRECKQHTTDGDCAVYERLELAQGEGSSTMAPLSKPTRNECLIAASTFSFGEWADFER